MAVMSVILSLETKRFYQFNFAQTDRYDFVQIFDVIDINNN